MPNIPVMVANESGAEATMTLEAPGPIDACAEAVADVRIAAEAAGDVGAIG